MRYLECDALWYPSPAITLSQLELLLYRPSHEVEERDSPPFLHRVYTSKVLKLLLPLVRNRYVYLDILRSWPCHSGLLMHRLYNAYMQSSIFFFIERIINAIIPAWKRNTSARAAARSLIHQTSSVPTETDTETRITAYTAIRTASSPVIRMALNIIKISNAG